MENKTPKALTNSKPEKSCVVCFQNNLESKIKIICSTCTKGACKLHSKLISGVHLCDYCIRNDLGFDIKNKSIKDLKKLKCELINLKNREEALTAEIRKKFDTIAELKIKINSEQLEHQKKVNELENKIQVIAATNKNSKDDIEMCENALKQCEKNTESLFGTMNAFKWEIVASTKENQTLINQNHSLHIEVQDLIKKCSNTIPYRRIRNTTCNKCHFNIKFIFKNDIFNIVQRTNSKSLVSIVSERIYSEQKDAKPCTCLIQ